MVKDYMTLIGIVIGEISIITEYQCYKYSVKVKKKRKEKKKIINIPVKHTVETLAES